MPMPILVLALVPPLRPPLLREVRARSEVPCERDAEVLPSCSHVSRALRLTRSESEYIFVTVRLKIMWMLEGCGCVRREERAWAGENEAREGGRKIERRTTVR